MSSTPQYNAEAILAAKDPRRFIPECVIETQNEEIRPMDPLGQGQVLTLDGLVENRWLKVRKYRQAWITTLAVMWLLGQVQYREGVRGVLVAEKTATAQESFRRLSFAYQNLPPAIRLPALLAERGGALEFQHGGGIKIITAGSDAPAIGNSPDRVVLTEFEEYPDQDLFNRHFYPAITRRPHARILDEATPGIRGSTGHAMWLKALHKESRFTALFLKWWEDPTFATDPQVVELLRRGFTPSQEELRLAGLMPGITPGHFMFRRLALDTEFALTGDEGFRHKYPYHEKDGWSSEDQPAVPKDAIEPYLLAAQRVNPRDEIYFVPWEEDAPYLVTADPAGFGKTGDPSAWTLWHGWDKKEVGSFSGREDPGKFAERLMAVQARYGGPYDYAARRGCLIAVEANKGECSAALVAKGAEGLYWTDPYTPGWVSTEAKKGDSLVALVDMLRKHEMGLLSEPTIDQLAMWDGKTRSRGRSKEGRHHYDRAITALIAAYIFKVEPMGLRPKRSTTIEKGGYSAQQFLDYYKAKERKRASGILGVLRS